MTRDKNSSDFYTDMRSRLLQLQAATKEATAEGAGSSGVVELDQSRQGRLSRMDAMQAQAMSQAANQRREVSLKNIAAAIERIENGNFGFCQACDELIAEQRLAFDPTAVLCIDCASSAEQR